MLITEYVTIKWNGNTKKYYESLGYTFTSYGDEFIIKASDLKPGSRQRVIAKCDCCGIEKSVYYYSYTKIIQSNNGKYYCHKCGCRTCGKYSVLSIDEVIKRIENKNNNKLLNPDDYKNVTTKNLIVQCGSCGDTFLTSLANIDSNGGRCRKCAYEYQHKNQYNRLTENDIIDIGKKMHVDILNPNEYINNATKNLKVFCIQCGDIFTTNMVRIKTGQSCCEKCRNSSSIGERQIQMILDRYDIMYEKQKWYSDCVDQRPLPFDFYLPKYNTIIEFDGQHHYEPIYDKDYDDLLITQKHDKIKNEYCEKNDIKLIRIPYWEGNNMETIIKNELNIA